VSLLDVNKVIRRNGAIDVAKEANKFNAVIEKADKLNTAIKEITNPIDVN
jgi:hypothetical protein